MFSYKFDVIFTQAIESIVRFPVNYIGLAGSVTVSILTGSKSSEGAGKKKYRTCGTISEKTDRVHKTLLAIATINLTQI